MNKYYFTFGIGNKLRPFVQTVSAPDFKKAKKVMHETYGESWLAGHDKKPDDLKDLPIIRYDSAPTESEQLEGWETRITDIKRTVNPYRISRLINLIDDIKNAYDLEQEEIGKTLYIRASLELDNAYNAYKEVV